MYVLVVKRVGPSLMENRKPFDLRYVMIAYNFLIVFTYISCLLLLCYFFLTTDAYKGICAPTFVTLDHYTYWATTAGWVIYILKYIEYCDTIFFVLRKKDHLVTNLHVIHHAVLPIIGWIFLRTETSGFQFIPGGLNSFVHILMYTYYGLAAMGPSVQKYLWWKEYLTKIQMLQFVIILVFVMIIIPLSGCKTSKHGIYIDILFAFLFLGLFYNFYTKTYKKSLSLKIKLPDPIKEHISNGNSSAPKQNGVKSKSSWGELISQFPSPGPIRRR
ncbi:elongation of very long chain fatty acids protein 7 [Trichonephila inaurata madagascariensis]|uniref:Elongation of very long chain fatty acids protein n=1 Tax=Trichonephila inaurata madagascariensis TaxID=2747483 RepID=A0A8X6Y7Y8_9ARAC|nr:elongation of very long chain fatty acids protein 7 [Trichonephila inaurata madagascariensis]